MRQIKDPQRNILLCSLNLVWPLFGPQWIRVRVETPKLTLYTEQHVRCRSVYIFYSLFEMHFEWNKRISLSEYPVVQVLLQRQGMQRTGLE